MALGTPSWLTLEFMEGILRRSEADSSIQVIDIFTKPATNKGDNYTSDMLRVTTEFTRKQGSRKVNEKKNVIIKVAPTKEGPQKELIMKSQIFETEMSMMTSTLPKMNDLLGGKYRVGGRCFHIQKENPMLLVIEDLAAAGFRMADRQAGLDLQHSLLAIRGLARFHATSVFVCEKDKQTLIAQKGMYHESHPLEMRTFFIESCKCLGKEVATWPELGQRYSEKIINVADHLYEKCCKLIKYQEDQFNVLCHGDPWVNNMMFKYDNDGKPIDHIFVDFQLCFLASPVSDLHYFLATSPSVEVLENEKETLLNEYLTTLTSTMKEIGCRTSPPTKEEMEKSMKERRFLEVVAAFCVLPLVLIDKSEVMDLNEIMHNDGGFHNPAYQGKIYRKVMTKRLPLYDQLGLLDI